MYARGGEPGIEAMDEPKALGSSFPSIIASVQVLRVMTFEPTCARVQRSYLHVRGSLCACANGVKPWISDKHIRV